MKMHEHTFTEYLSSLSNIAYKRYLISYMRYTLSYEEHFIRLTSFDTLHDRVENKDTTLLILSGFCYVNMDRTRKQLISYLIPTTALALSGLQICRLLLK